MLVVGLEPRLQVREEDAVLTGQLHTPIQADGYYESVGVKGQNSQ